MAEKYDYQAVEKKWQQRWEEREAFRATENSGKKKSFLLIEFPYPSGDGLHVGHIRSWTALDVVARKRRMQGEEVLYPIGWDAFGLPAENYALKTGIHPKISTKQNTDNFRRQIKNIGISFDWSREVNTTDPSYYKWTQWIFQQMFKKGLAYKAKTTINWCPKDKIGLANEEVVDGACERCGTPVEKREKEQWMLAITKYAKRLYDDLDTVDYIERAKVQQRNWIGPSEGAEIAFPLNFTHDLKANENRGPNGEKAQLSVFTTRPDTLYGATYLVLAPEHVWITLAADEDHNVLSNKEEVRAYAEASKKRTEIERTAEGKEKTGVELKGVKAINPATKEEIPMYVADYVLGGYGTGAIMAVPAHDQRDFEFAKKFKLPVRAVVGSDAQKEGEVWTGPGILKESGAFNGLTSEEGKKKITESVGGEWKTVYKLRDWVFSRQRYWGEPIPMVNCAKCGWVPVPESELPVQLPEVEKYQPGEEGESPLANIAEWINATCPSCKGPAKRESDVMPNWAGSSWYYLRYTDPQNTEELAGKEKLAYWTPVDWYNGGMEHTTLHLLYSRFWHKFLFDQGLVPSSEPYAKRTSHGLILAEGGEKMSKSKGNTVSPDDLVRDYGADALRLYEMFIGPFDQPVAWNTSSMSGMSRFIERVWKLEPKEAAASPELETLLHQTIKKVGEDAESLKMNTAVSAMMILLNALEKETSKNIHEIFLALLAPFAPHLCSELGEKYGYNLAAWPTYNANKLASSLMQIAVQVNGKTRGILAVPAGAGEEEVFRAARAEESVAKWLSEGEETKTLYVPGKIVSFVVRPKK